MDFLNLTPFQIAQIIGRINFPAYSLTIIAKSTFDLKLGKTVILSKEQFYPSGDEYYPEDEEMKGGPRYSSDLDYFKPKADLILVGKFHSPENKKVFSSHVKFQVGSKTKTLNVFGNRYWVGSNVVTNPEPFSELELRYENSFGGIKYKKNPVGKGIEKVEIKTGDKLVPLPNILHYGENISSQNAKFEPAGYGPFGQMWTQRFSKLGTYKGNYLKERWPWFAKDFDWEYFNTAPTDMQISGYLKGDEKLYFENMHPIHSEYYSQLPGIRLRCFFRDISDEPEKNLNVIEQKYFKEVKMNLDTLWVDMENEKLVLVWRGVSEIKSEDYEEEIQNIFIVSEKIEEMPQSIDYYRRLLEEELAVLEEEILEPEPVAANEEDEEDIEMEAEIAKAEEQMRTALIEAGIDPDNPPEPSEEEKRKEAELLKELGFEEEKEQAPLTREIFIDRAKNKESFEGEDLKGIDLSELDLQGLNFQNTILSGVILRNSNLSNSNFMEANLSGTDLSDSVLNNINLKDADLTGAIISNVDLKGAIVEGAVFEKADLKNALLNNVKGKNSFFSEADLTGASLILGEFQGADFSKAVLNNANFMESNLSKASLENASCKETNFSKADLYKLKASGGDFTKAIFQKSIGSEITFGKSNLTEADFSYCDMEGANFTSAWLEKANLYAANMKFARFMKANLTGAILRKMNLFQGSFEKADLTKADCNGSNFYAVEFLDTKINKTTLISTNLKMTKLSR